MPNAVTPTASCFLRVFASGFFFFNLAHFLSHLPSFFIFDGTAAIVYFFFLQCFFVPDGILCQNKKNNQFGICVSREVHASVHVS